jgi:hypothetical protein
MYLPFAGNNVRDMRCCFLVASRYSSIFYVGKLQLPVWYGIVYARSDSVVQKIAEFVPSGSLGSSYSGESRLLV